MNVPKQPMLPFVVAVVPALIGETVKKKAVPWKRLVGAAIYGLLLWGVYAWRGDVGSALAWVVAISSFLVNGPTILTIVQRLV